MAHLYPNLRLYQVFGANTDVGKTIFTTALCLASSTLPFKPNSSSTSHLPSSTKSVFTPHPDAEKVFYLKPVSTGAASDSDDVHIAKYSPHTQYKTLYRFKEPVSPHLAVELERRAKLAEREVGQEPPTPTNEDFVRGVGEWIHSSSSSLETSNSAPSSLQHGLQRGVAYVETAGGVHSPSPTGLSQSQLLRPLRLPTILIGSSELGGISTTRSAFESLLIAGYDVEAVLMFPSPRYGNVEYLTQYFKQEHGIPVFGLGGSSTNQDGNPHGATFGPPPTKNVVSHADQEAMERYYQAMVHGNPHPATKEETEGGVYRVVDYLRAKHSQRIENLATLSNRTRKTVWWPFTQHTLTKSDREVNVIDSAYGDYFSMLDQRDFGLKSSNDHVSDQIQTGQSSNSSLLQPIFDGSASWWTQCLGHAPNRLVLAAAKAGGRYGHVLFPNGTHEPALLLSEALTGKSVPSSVSSSEKGIEAPGAGWADRVFFSDDGSTGMEVALKMALQSSISRYTTKPTSAKAVQNSEKGRNAGYMSGRPKQEWEILGLKGSYHGDTIGVMDACEPSVYSEAVHWYRGRGFWFDPPTVEITQDGTKITLQVQDPDQARKASSFLPSSVRSETGRDKEEADPTKVFQKTYRDVQEVYDVERRISSSDPLCEFYRAFIRNQLEELVVQQGRKFGALVLEPIVMGAGGMIFVDPLFQRILVDVVRSSEDLFSMTDVPGLKTARAPSPSKPSVSSSDDGSEWRGIPVIFDEVFTGLYRLGACTGGRILGVKPDISVLAKILTGGLVPMSVTLASRSIFNTFNRSESKVDALLHGHSYTAHPIGCQVALETLEAIEELKTRSEDWVHARQDWTTPGQTQKLQEQDSSITTTTASEAPSSGARASNIQGEQRALRQQQEMGQENSSIWSFWSKDVVEQLAGLPNVDHVMAMGCVLKISLYSGSGSGYTSTVSTDILRRLRFGPSSHQPHPTIPSTNQAEADSATLPFNIHARPLGNVIYLMSSLNTPPKVLRQTEKLLYKAVKEQNSQPK